MKFLVGISVFFSSYKSPQLTMNQMTPLLEMPAICVEDYECELPYRCCEGFIINYCCKFNGHPMPYSRRNGTVLLPIPV